MRLWERLQLLFGFSPPTQTGPAKPDSPKATSKRGVEPDSAKATLRRGVESEGPKATSKKKAVKPDRPTATSKKKRPVKPDRPTATSKKRIVEPDSPKAKGAGEPVRLNAASVVALSTALRALEPGRRGWISFDDAARLFFPTGEHFSEWDEANLRALGEFAAQTEHRSTPERNASQQRVYFTRIKTIIL